MNYIGEDNSLGSQLKPVRNNLELEKVMVGKNNCIIYTVGTFKVEELNLLVLKEKNIKLVGLAFAQLKYKPRKRKEQGKIPTNIVVDEFSTISLDIKVDTNIKLEQKDRYISGGMH